MSRLERFAEGDLRAMADCRAISSARYVDEMARRKVAADALISSFANAFATAAPVLERQLAEAETTLPFDRARRSELMLMAPLYRAALDFSNLYKAQLAAAADAQVKANQ